MCFSEVDYEWTIDEDIGQGVMQAPPGGAVCEECGREIRVGDLMVDIHQVKYWDEEAEEGDDRDDPLVEREWLGELCGSCELTRFRIYCHELEEGCQPWQSWCPIGDLVEYCLEADLPRASTGEGQLFLAWKLRNQRARKETAHTREDQ